MTSNRLPWLTGRLCRPATALTVLGLLAPPAGAAEEGRRVHDVVAGFTFVVGSAALNAPDQPVRIKVGDTMAWTNLDPVSHDIAFEAEDFRSYLRSPGDTAEHTFRRAGYFTYACNQHPELPGMRGLVFVTE